LIFQNSLNNAIRSIKIATRPKTDNVSGVVEKGEIVNVLKRLMEEDEGLEIRERMKGPTRCCCIESRWIFHNHLCLNWSINGPI
jgi:hypothetical protein